MTDDYKDFAVELKRRGISPSFFKAQQRRGLSTEQILAPWPQQPLSNRVGSRRFRRRLVVGTYAGWLLIVAIVRLITLPNPGWVKPGDFIFVFVGLAMLNALIGVIWLERRTYINSPKLRDIQLDERLVEIRNQAFRRAFQVFAPVALIGWGLSWAAIQWQPNVQGWINAFMIFSAVALLASTLPTAIVAWNEPDPAEPEPSPPGGSNSGSAMPGPTGPSLKEESA